MSKDHSVGIRPIHDCIRRIEEYVRDGKEAFLADRKTQDAVIRNLEVIGQAVRDMGIDDLIARYPGTPWAQIAASRNVLAHQYLGVDIQLVWNIVEQHLPQLAADIRDVAACEGIVLE